MAYETRMTPNGRETQVMVISQDERDTFDELYKTEGLETTTEKIEFWKRRLGYSHYHSKKGYTEKRHLGALERAALIEVL